MPWVTRVLALPPEPDPFKSLADAAAELCAEGVTLVGDYGARASAVSAGLIDGRHYRELLRDDPPPQDAESIAIHAVHTVHRASIEALGGRAIHMSVHAGESAEEMRLYRDGTGPMADLLAARGFPPDHVAALKGRSPIAILDELGLVSPRLQIVHGMHLPDADLRVIAERKAHVVLCPVSNRNIGTAFLPGDDSGSRVRTMIELGISLALGTDSRLSCDRLSLKDCAGVLLESGIDQADIEKMLRNRAAIGM